MPASAEPIVIAHRGASAVAPENTRSAIKAAIEMGAKVIEFDVRETSDGVLVLFHDADLKRFLGRKESIESLRWDEVKGLDVGGWFEGGAFAGETPILFETALRLCLEHGVTPLIEHKSGAPENYASVLEKLDVVDEVIVQSFSWTFLRGVAEVLPNLRIGALGTKKLDSKKVEQLLSLRPDWVGWKYSDLSSKAFFTLKEKGFLVALWTVNDPKEAAKWMSQGVDGVITDYPDKMMKISN